MRRVENSSDRGPVSRLHGLYVPGFRGLFRLPMDQPVCSSSSVCFFPKVISRSKTYRIARYNRLPSRKSSIGAVSGFSGGLAVVTNPPASSRIAIPAATSLIQSDKILSQSQNTRTNSPLPTTPLPPNIKSPHSSIRQIQRRTPQTAHTMNHPTPPIPPTNFSSHIDKTLNLAMHIAIRDIAAVLAPFTAEDALRGRVRGHGRDGGLVD